MGGNLCTLIRICVISLNTQASVGRVTVHQKQLDCKYSVKWNFTISSVVAKCYNVFLQLIDFIVTERFGIL